MGKKINMIDRKFGRLNVLNEVKQKDKDGSIKYLCLCDCGNKKIINGTSLRSGRIVSCGCYNKEIITKKEPFYKDKLYGILSSMKQRCYNKNDKAYKNYGNRGIKICDEWLNNYLNFKEWALSNGYKEGLWIDRIDNNKNYEPNNCRWATPKEQQNNKRVNVVLTINGQSKNIKEWAEYSGIKHGTLYRRLQLGWNPDDLLKEVNKKYSHSEAIKKSLKKII